MTQIERLHQEPSVESSLEAYQQDLWRLMHSQAYRALDSKSCFPAISHQPAPSILLLASRAAHFARTLAARISLNAPLTECLLIARLLGYPAGGEFSIRILSRSMQKYGGFSLTDHSLRVIEELEMTFPEFNGLNLAWSIRGALGATPSQIMRTFRETSPDSPEHGVVAFSTRLSLLELELLHFPTELRSVALEKCSLWSSTHSSISATYPQLEPKRLFTFTLHQFLLRLLDESSLVTRQLPVTLTPLSDQSLQDLEHALHHEKKKALVQSQHAQALEKAYTSLFHQFVNHPQTIPEKHSLRIKKDGIHRVCCDYLASLSDRELLALHQHYTPASAPAENKQQLDLL